MNTKIPIPNKIMTLNPIDINDDDSQLEIVKIGVNHAISASFTKAPIFLGKYREFLQKEHGSSLFKNLSIMTHKYDFMLFRHQLVKFAIKILKSLNWIYYNSEKKNYYFNLKIVQKDTSNKLKYFERATNGKIFK